MTFDPFASINDNLIAPASKAFIIAPDDAVALSHATKALYVGSGGDINVRLVDSASDVVLSNVPSGTVLAIRVIAIRASATTAENLVGLA